MVEQLSSVLKHPRGPFKKILAAQKMESSFAFLPESVNETRQTWKTRWHGAGVAFIKCIKSAQRAAPSGSVKWLMVMGSASPLVLSAQVTVTAFHTSVVDVNDTRRCLGDGKSMLASPCGHACLWWKTSSFVSLVVFFWSAAATEPPAPHH